MLGMRRTGSALLLAALLCACGGSTDDDGQGTGGSSGAGGSSGSGGSGGSSGTGGSGGGIPCEGFVPCCDSQGNPVSPICPGGGPAECPPGTTVPPTGICGGDETCSPTMPCSSAEFCDYPDDLCGAGASGTCAPRPEGCEFLYAPVCGCDGAVHSNACAGQTTGSDVSATGGCAPPGGEFACGPLFCQTGSEYCLRGVSDVGGIPDQYECRPVPPDCGTAPSCACLANEPCGDWCETLAPGAILLTCPGG
jgi:hypothetical protein